jgi:hypothetical protein
MAPKTQSNAGALRTASKPASKPASQPASKLMSKPASRTPSKPASKVGTARARTASERMVKLSIPTKPAEAAERDPNSRFSSEPWFTMIALKALTMVPVPVDRHLGWGDLEVGAKVTISNTRAIRIGKGADTNLVRSVCATVKSIQKFATIEDAFASSPDACKKMYPTVPTAADAALVYRTMFRASDAEVLVVTLSGVKTGSC